MILMAKENLTLFALNIIIKLYTFPYIGELSDFQKIIVEKVIEHFKTLDIEDNLFSILYVNNEKTSRETEILFYENESITIKSI